MTHIYSVVNHHMLFADLAKRGDSNNYKDPSILPAYHRVILDEAHNIEDIATDYFASKVSQVSIMHTLSRLASDKQGKLPLLKDKLQTCFRKNPPREFASIHSRLNVDLPAMRRDLLQQTADTFQAYGEFIIKMQPRGKNQEEAQPGESKLRILSTHLNHEEWREKMLQNKAAHRCY